MADERDRLLEAKYDGIQEYDNPIPLWLNLIFVGTVVFSVIYMAYYHVLGLGPLQEEAYAQEMAAYAEVREAVQAQAAQVDLSALAADDEAVGAGENVYATNCAACHGQNGEGQIGPSLVDDQWIHGDGSMATIVEVVDVGVIDKGMPAWGPVLGPEKVQQVSAYIHSLGSE